MIDITTRNQVFYYSQKGFSMSLIAKTFGISRVTVKKYLMKLKNFSLNAKVIVQLSMNSLKKNILLILL